MKKKLFYLFVILLALLSLLTLAQFIFAGYFFDKNLDKIINRIERQVPNLDLEYDITSSSFLNRTLRVYVTFNRQISNFDRVSMGFDCNINFALMGVNGDFKSLPNYGNINDILKTLNLSNIDLNGAFDASLIKRKASVAIKSSSFAIPFDGGFCQAGENAFTLEAKSLDKTKVLFKAGGLSCKANDYYLGNPAFWLQLKDFALGATPKLKDGELELEQLDLSLSNLLFDVSTIYALGFSPEEKVKDPSLRDRLDFSNLALTLNTKNKDQHGFSDLDIKMQGNYHVAFPYVKQGVILPSTDFDNLLLDLKVQKVNLSHLRALLKARDDNFFPLLLDAVSKDVALEVKSFAFNSHGGEFNNHGRLSFNLNSLGKIDNIVANFEFKASPVLIEALANEYQFKREFNNLVALGFVHLSQGFYHTSLNVQGSDIYVNNQKL